MELATGSAGDPPVAPAVDQPRAAHQEVPAAVDQPGPPVVRPSTSPRPPGPPREGGGGSGGAFSGTPDKPRPKAAGKPVGR